jgi:hypothetical protein
VGSLALSGGLTLTAGTFHLDGGNLQTVLPINIASSATFEGNGTVSAFGGTLGVSGTVIASDAGHTLDFGSAVTGNGNFEIAAGATLEFGGSVASGTTVTFLDGTGELVLDHPDTFDGTIAGFNGTAPNPANSDVIDLVGIDHESASFSQNYLNGVLTVSDGIHTAHLKFSNFTDQFEFASDTHGGTLVFDPPASPAAAPKAPADLGTNFLFQPGMGTETISHFDPLHDTIELDHFANVRTVSQLTALVTSDDHNNAVITLGQTDTLTINGITAQQLQAMIGNVAHLH